MAVPYTFAGATSSIPLSQLDTNFASTITLGNTAIQLGNTVTTLNNMTLANVTISSGNVTITNVSVTTANVTTGNITTLTSTNATLTNMSSGNVTITGGTINGTTLGATTASSANVTTLTTSSTVTLNGGTANGVAYLNGSKVLTTGSALTFDGSSLRFSGNLGFGGSGFGSNGSGLFLNGYGNYGSGIYSDATGLQLIFQGNSSEQMRLTSTGLGIGTSSPGAKLEVYGGASGTVTNAQIGNASTAFLVGVDSSNNAQIRTAQSVPILFYTAATERARITSAGSFVVGTAAIATNATDGFLYVPTCAGTPTGTPTTQTGTAPIVIDTTNNKLYFYSGGQWRDAGP